MNAISYDLRQSISRTGASDFGSGWEPRAWYWAPGRIELIGNHVDYNGGPVLAAAIDRGIVVAGDQSGPAGSIQAVFPDLGDESIRSCQVPGPLDWQSTAPVPQPIDYMRGAVTALGRRGYEVRGGSRLVVSGNLPFGIGISSSAAFCVALVLSMSAQELDPHEIVLAAQEAENRAGTPCGTMDQSASVFGELIRYDGSTGDVLNIDADLGEHLLLVINSGIVRSLAASAYPDRVHETIRALGALRSEWKRNLASLAEIGLEDLDAVLDVLHKIGQPTLAARVRHVVTECDRVNQAEVAISHSDWTLVGGLMTESDRSSAGDYDISHPAVEELVALCLACDGVLGARMMGGGQGGSALALVRKDAADELESRLDSDYFANLPNAAPAVKYLPCTFSEGAGPITVR